MNNNVMSHGATNVIFNFAIQKEFTVQLVARLSFIHP
jgi:hypothetical protein